jgi:bifunctional pyridoxal-dependent enzyme with beta-cystathionase and maltose regulon repressor activities
LFGHGIPFWVMVVATRSSRAADRVIFCSATLALWNVMASVAASMVLALKTPAIAAINSVVRLMVEILNGGAMVAQKGGWQNGQFYLGV